MMGEGESGIFVHHIGQSVYIRVNGRGSFQNSQPLRSFTGEMCECGCRQFILDLQQCAGMDSTFLGVLTGIGLSLRERNPPGTVHVINATPHSRDLLKSLWLDRLFSVKPSAAELPGFKPPADTDLQPLPGSDPSAGPKLLQREGTRELMQTAHDNLIRADRRNELKFAEVIKQLRNEAPAPRDEGHPPATPR
jgi:anti-anti-sigma regulatory factor